MTKILLYVCGCVSCPLQKYRLFSADLGDSTLLQSIQLLKERNKGKIIKYKRKKKRTFWNIWENFPSAWPVNHNHYLFTSL